MFFKFKGVFFSDPPPPPYPSEVSDFGGPDNKFLNLCRETVHYSVKSGKNFGMEIVFLAYNLRTMCVS